MYASPITVGPSPFHFKTRLWLSVRTYFVVPALNKDAYACRPRCVLNLQVPQEDAADLVVVEVVVVEALAVLPEGVVVLPDAVVVVRIQPFSYMIFCLIIP